MTKTWVIKKGGEVQTMSSSMARAYAHQLEDNDREIYLASMNDAGTIIHEEGPIQVIDRWGRLYGDTSRPQTKFVALIAISVAVCLGAVACNRASNFGGTIICVGLSIFGTLWIHFRERAAMLRAVKQGTEFSKELSAMIGPEGDINNYA